jgi:molecular chaperone GrpE
MEEQTMEKESKEEVKGQAETEEVENVENLEEAKEEKKEKKEEDFKEKYYYLAAEMQNMQKRMEREKSDLLKYGNERILRDMLEVADNFERTLNAIKMIDDEQAKNIVFGIEMVSKQFMDSLFSHGIKEVKALGEVFDPNFHEAMEQMHDDKAKEDEILKVHQVGYTLNERLLRPAKVVVCKKEK